MSKRQGDIDKALSNFIPFFNKDAFVRYQHPKFEKLFMKCQVIMDDTITEEHPEQLDALDYDVVTCTCNFVFKTWIFCGNDKSAGKNGERIHHIISTYVDPDGDGISDVISVITDTEYDGFLPTIRQINVGFYPVPIISDYLQHMEWVDSLWPAGYDDHPFVDRLIWKIDESGEITGQVGNSYHYPHYSSEYLSGYYDERRVSCDGFINGQLSTYNYLSGPDDDHKPYGLPIMSDDMNIDRV